MRIQIFVRRWLLFIGLSLMLYFVSPMLVAVGQTTPAVGADAIANAYELGLSNLMVEATGTVTRLLADDSDGSRHQRFILRLETGSTILISHNLDIAPRITPLAVGDILQFRGEYEWNDLGGIVHWTHHDPQGRHPDGWILHDGRRYE